MRLNLSFLAC